MKRKNVLIVTSLISFLLISLGILLSVSSKDEEEVTYSKVNISGYEFDINDEYKYKFLKEEDYGVLEDERFLTSFIYIADEDFPTLISRTSYYTNMNSDEIDSIIEESKFGEFDGFKNIKKVYYDDVGKEFNLVVILIKISKKQTFVFQYEIDNQEGVNDIIKDIDNGLKKFEKKV